MLIYINTSDKVSSLCEHITRNYYLVNNKTIQLSSNCSNGMVNLFKVFNFSHLPSFYAYSSLPSRHYCDGKGRSGKDTFYITMADSLYTSCHTTVFSILKNKLWSTTSSYWQKRLKMQHLDEKSWTVKTPCVTKITKCGFSDFLTDRYDALLPRKSEVAGKH